MNEATASIVRTLIKTAGVVIIFGGWPKFRKPHVFNQTVIQSAQADDLVMRSVIMELHSRQESEAFAYFERSPEEATERTDGYYMPRAEWEKAGKPDSISVTVSSLVSGVNV